jgi:transcriptional regulator
MYTPTSFQIDSIDQVASVLQEYSFATLIQRTDKSVEATHVPVLADLKMGKKGVIRGHVAKANPIAKLMAGSQETLIIFQGPHCYVSPTWYKNNDGVPTWNYVAIHTYGRATIIEDDGWLISLLKEMTKKYESSMENPWTFDPSIMQKQVLLRMIVGFEIEIDRVEAKFKLNQNRKDQERQGVIEALEQRPTENNLKIADWMKRL